MADLTDNQAAQTVKIIGADSAGLEGTPVGSDSSGHMLTAATQGPPNTAANAWPQKIIGATDNTPIGNTGDRLKVDANITSVAAGSPASNILKQNEYTLVTRAETDVPGVTYTVPAGKTFTLVSFMASFDAQPTLYIRLKKQTGGTGAFSTVFRINLEVGGQGQSTVPLTFPNGVLLGAATDVFKLTVESSIVKGNLWAAFAGIEQ